ncbi:MAG: hypothetical protein ACREXY_07415 [Gammaproteobacteria bacterium]
MSPKSRRAAGVLLIVLPTGHATRSECGFPENGVRTVVRLIVGH